MLGKNMRETEFTAQMRADEVDAIGLREDRTEPELSRVVQIAGTALRVPLVAFFVFHGDEPRLIASFGRGLHKATRETDLSLHVIRQGRALFLDHLNLADQTAETGGSADGIGLYAGIPVRSPSRENIGVLCASAPNGRKLSIAERRLLGECAGLIEDQLRLRQLSQRDTLTGLLTRREFDLKLDADWRRAFRSHGSLAVAMLDIDYFKQINDQLGHAEGDEVLRRVADMTQNYLRKDQDAVGRYGGDEFALSMPGIDPWTAHKRLAGLCERIRQQRIPNPAAPLGVITVSIGVAGLEQDADFAAMAVDRLLLRADEALYQSKTAGRNQVSLIAGS